MKKTIQVIPWNEHYSLGITVIDIQHRHLFNLINEFVYELIFDEEDKTQGVVELFDKLSGYCSYHFSTEEEVWSKKNIKQSLLIDHHDEHHDLFIRIEKFKERISKLEPGLVTNKFIFNEVIPFLVRWLSFHILEKDRFLAVISKHIDAGDNYENAYQTALNIINDKVFYLSLYVELYVGCFKSLARIAGLITNRDVLKRISIQKDSYYRHIINNAADPIWTIDKISNQLVEYNESLLKYCKQYYSEVIESNVTSEYDLNGFTSKFKIYYAQVDANNNKLTIEFHDPIIDRYLLITFSFIENSEFSSNDEICVFVKDITDNKKNIDYSNRLFFYDSLTNLPNRKFMLERIRLAHEASRTTKQYNALLLLDIDNFHLINDKFSSVVADDILIEMRNRLVDFLPETDNLARIGADSFCVLFTDVSTDKRKTLHSTIDLANQIQAVLTIPFEILQNRFSISVSLGAVLFADEDDFEVDQIIGFAESAQLLSKKEGINQLNFYQNELQQLAINNLLIENELRFALPDQLRVFYQLQFDSKKNIVGTEALIRWQHPLKGMLSPDKFISIAEESGLILPIGYWLFDTVFHQISLWNNHLNIKMKNIPISVNISVKQFYDPNLIDYLVSLLKKHQISPSLIKLEITETLMMEDFSYFKKIFSQLRGLGFQLSLDDFGVGYSSLSVISEIDFDEIKIDKSFIDCLINSNKSQTIVKMIVALGKELNVNLVAEGLENTEQYDLLVDLGVDCFQGYLFSYPLPVEDLKCIEH